MRNKGFVKFIAVALTIICLFYLSFSFVTRYHEKKAVNYPEGESAYIDSIMNEKVYLGIYDFKTCREMGIGLGLDLKGGMNVVLEVSVPDVVDALADHKQDENFKSALATASKQAITSNDDFITLFIREYKRLNPEGSLAELFATQQLKDKVNTKSTDKEVESVIRSEVQDAIDNSFNVLRTRIDRFGVAQPNIQKLEGTMGRIMIELPGVKEPERVRNLLQGSANLEFWETYASSDVYAALAAADAKLRDILALEQGEAPAAEEAAPAEEPAAEQAVVAEDTTKTDDLDLSSLTGDKKSDSAEESVVTEQMKREHPLLSLLQVYNNSSCIAGIARHKDMDAIDEMLARKEVQDLLPKDLLLKWGVSPMDEKSQVYELYAIKSTERNGRAPLEGDVIVNAKDDYDQNGRPDVSMSMNTEGSRRWAQITKNNIGKAVAIVLDDRVYSAPTVQVEISGGNSQITGNFTQKQTKDLANVLNSGKMPAPAKIVQEDIVGPSLGAQSIRQGIWSFIIAFIILMFYMCFMYGWIPGLIADGALLLNLFFTLGILSSFQAALTMSGIAGMVLTLGMAVDANVLIYERAKEELRAGKQVKAALKDGYKNAFSAIFDSNFTSIITGIILFVFGTGPIRGFATTLMIGIVCSFFTAVFLTRIVYEHFLNKDKLTNLTFSTPFAKKVMPENTHFDFMGKKRISFAIFGLLIVIFAAAYALRGFDRSIDFTGGRNFTVQFENPVSPEQVNSLLADKVDNANLSVIALGTDGKTVRISTNYRIEDDADDIDTQIERFLFDALKSGNLLSSDLDFETFINHENRTGGSIISSQKVGPSIASDITKGAIISVILALIAIFLYILLRFRNVAYSLGAIGALVVDTIMILGMYALLHGVLPFSMELDQTFIGAILTAIGYSINDKVVIFDRIRENRKLYPKREIRQLFNDSLNSTLARTINTSVSTLIVLLCILFIGGSTIKSFAFAMILGVIFGTLSSIFLAAPIAQLTMKKRGQKAVEAKN
ncbi:MAG: protein translocase subunit SecDF [Bacteroidaceae bacterium]|nr:protein translocase subunit SecDF [Bacteroidaceae bacterium]